MGPVRRKLSPALLGLVPAPALAQSCAVARPGWDGVPVTALQEALQLFASAPAVALLVLSVLAIRFRSAWGGLVVVLLWTGFVSLLAFAGGSTASAARAEGCIGSPTLFIAAVAAICIAMILYTAPFGGRDQNAEKD